MTTGSTGSSEDRDTESSGSAPAAGSASAAAAPPPETAAGKKAPARRTVGVTRSARPRTAAGKATAKKATAKKPAARKPTTKATAKKATAKSTAKKATAKSTAKAAATGTATRRTTPRTPVEIASTHRRHKYRTLDERIARGLQWRDAAPLNDQDRFEPSASRPSALGMLRAQDDDRVADLIPIRYGRMSASPFAFYRGSATVMAYDLAQEPSTPGRTQICGDAHLSNFGFFASPERDLVFDVNDFDETLPGPFEWDVKRLTASVVLAARSQGFTRKQAKAAAIEAGEGYRSVIQQLAASRTLDVWYTKVDADLIRSGVMRLAKAQGDKKFAKRAGTRLDETFAKARGKTSIRAADKLTSVVDGKRQFREQPPLLQRELGQNVSAAQVEEIFVQYKGTLESDRRRLIERYKFRDLALKVVGVGSVGTRALVLLMEGRDMNDPLVLQAKEAQASVLESYLGESRHGNHGERVVHGQRYMQAFSDIFLGWVRTAQGRDFYIRQLHDMKGSIDVSTLRPEGLSAYARICGITLARAHARGGDVVAISSYLGDTNTFSKAVARFGLAYADQAEKDYAELQAAVADGSVPVKTGV
jgi:uncharacterized protein (DUF2252 family)